jgi:HAD superfamily hydrolase (TIGR01509 family)
VEIKESFGLAAAENDNLERLEFMIRAIIFDMDGLMFDTERLYHDTTVQAAEEMGYSGISGIAYEMIGLREAECIALYERRLGSGFPYPRLAGRRQELMDALLRDHGMPIKPGLFELLGFLKRENYLMAVATSTRRRLALSYLEQSGVAPYLDRMIFGDMLARSKPAPDIYLKTASELGTDPSECMALEDSPRGIQSAHFAGMTTVMVPDLVKPDESLKKICDFCVPSLFDVMELVRNGQKESGT